MLLESCEITVIVNARQQGEFFVRKLLSNHKSVISSYFKSMVFLARLLLLDNQNILFYPTTQANLTLYPYIINHKILKILVKNTFHWFLYIFHCYKLGSLLDIAYKNCFLVDTQSIYNSAGFLPLSYLFSYLSTRFPPSLANLLMETILENAVNVYRNANAIRQIDKLIAEYLLIWDFYWEIIFEPDLLS